MKAGLLLEDGSFFPGIAAGARTTILGECVFHTSHQGYQEILSDPSYHKQIMIFSAPMIGNQGFSKEDFESSRLWAAGAVMREIRDSAQWRRQKSLDETLKEFSIPALSGVDTRRLVLKLREKGNLWGVLSTETGDVKKLQKFFRKNLSMEGQSLTADVSTKNAYEWTEGSNALLTEAIGRWVPEAKGFKSVVVLDFGVKHQILRYLKDSGFEKITVLPASTKASEILSYKADAVFLSNGPGDPAADSKIIEEVKALHGKVPLFGICLGHQILALSLGIQTFKLKFGHHAANHPVMNSLRDRVEISSQNHNFAVPHEAMKGLEYTHINLNDQTVEGFRQKDLRIFGIQYHPESSPGPLDSVSVFQDFQRGAIEWK